MPSEYQGLTSKEAKKKLEKFGPNVLPEKPPPSDFSIFIAQIKNPLVYVLVAAGFVSLVLQDIAGSTIIFFAVILNGVLGFFQERRASRALFALKKLIHPEAKVVRDGKIITIDAANIVPGDIAVLSAGDKIPADGKLIEANRLFIDEAILTGESVPVKKLVTGLESLDSSNKDKKASDQRLETKNQIFMGTIIASGQGKMLVEVTGKDTQIGKIALSIQEPSSETPLRKQLTILSKQLSILVFILTAFVFIVGFISGRNLSEMFTTSVALSVSAIPEGILVGLTIVLAIGMQRILKKKGLVRNLISAETLGGVTTICIDKTGTLTEGKMQVVDVLGDERKIATQMILANDHDDPIVIAGFEWAKKSITNSQLVISKLIKKYRRLDSIPFSSKERFFTSLHGWSKNKKMIFVNGAPEMLLEWTNMSKSKRVEVEKEIERLSSEGKRLIGLARKEVGASMKKLKNSDVKGDLEWIGLLAFSDPVRGGVKEALEKTRDAGIKLIVITGDYPQTAVSVMKQLNLKLDTDSVIMGVDLKKMSSKELEKKLEDPTSSRSTPGLRGARLFARTTPDQKLIIVEALRANGEVVAMMGDGVNDAPALNRADIGIVVGEATEVAKESADLVLLDSSFATIVSAIEEGRGIFDNVRKIILYLMSDAFEEIIAVVGTIILGLPLPVTAAQILWINLVSDGFPDMALTIDPKRPGIMQSPPRSPEENLVSSWMKKLIFIVSSVGGIIALGLFVYFYKTTNNIVLARSIAFAALGVNSLIYVFSIRTLREPFWKENPLDNIWLNISVVAGFALQLLPFSTPALRDFFGITSLTVGHWGIVFASSLLMFIIIEVNKVFLKDRLPVG